jgi:FkbM family methyltransferase
MTESTLTVVVPSYNRVEALSRCLDGVRGQSRPPDEVIVTVHASDTATVELVDTRRAGWPQLELVSVRRPGVVAAQNAALAAATGAIVAFCDDDAVPYPDWVERLLETFATDERIAAVGGRDVIHMEGALLGDEPVGGWRRLLGAPPVGRIQWWGRLTGNHHRSDAPAGDVDVLKGVNMAFRLAEIVEHGFDDRLLGHGAVLHHELSACLPLRRRGLRVVYDPRILVAHYPAPRMAGDDRDDFRLDAVAIASHNETLPILDHIEGRRRLVYFAWAVAIGTGEAPGIAAAMREMVRGRPAAHARFRAAQAGRLRALRTHRRQRRAAPSPVLVRTSTAPRFAIAGRVVSWLPADLIRLLGRWQYRIPPLRRATLALNRSLTETEGTIARGVGAGLRFNCTGGQPGYLIGTSEPSEQEVLRTHLRPGSVFYDVGANIGFFATLAGRLVAPGGHVWAFEPLPESAARARHNAALNGFDHVKVVQAAIGVNAARRRLSLGEFTGVHRVDGDLPGPLVDVIALDDWAREQRALPPDLVMIDAEGAELDVLEGMRELLAEHRPVVVCEVHWQGDAFQNFTAARIGPLGYRVEVLDGDPTAGGRWHALLLPEATALDASAS